MSAVFLALCLLGAPQRVAILPSVIGAEDGSRGLFDDTRAEAGHHVGLEVAGYDALFLDGAPPLAERALRCGSDLACVRAEFEGGDWDLVLLMTRNERLTPALASAELLDLGSGEVRARALDEAGKAPAELVSEVLEAAGFPVGGHLLLTVDPADAQLAPSPGAGSGPWLLRAGPHAFEIRRSGFRTERLELVIPPRSRISRQLRLEPEASDDLWSSPWLWTAVGVAVVGAATAGIVAATQGGGGCHFLVGEGSAAPPCP